MAKSGNPSSRKPRKKRKSINFMTRKEKEQTKVQRNSTSQESLPSSKHTVDELEDEFELSILSGSVASTSKMHTGKGSTPKNSRTIQQDSVSENLSLSSSKENSLEISTSGKSINIMSTTQRKAPGHGFKSPTKVQQNKKPDLKTQTKKRKRKSINFVAAKDKRPATIHHHSMTGHTLTRGNKVNANATTFKNSRSSISKLSDTPGQLDGRLDSRSSGSFRRESTSSIGRSRISRKRKLTGDKIQETTPGRQAKKRKKSKAENKETSPNTSFTSITSSTRGGSVKSKRTSSRVALDRIRDLKVTKKAFGNWKPMSKVTIGFVEAILKSVVLNASAEANLKNDAHAETCLNTLKTKVMERLPNLKAPYTKGDYRKMESQNKVAEDEYLEKSRELNVLDKKIEDEQRLLDKEMSMVAEFTKKLENYENELETLEREMAYPLIQQTRNVLNLPKLPDDFFKDEMLVVEESEEEKNLSKTLLQLRRNTNDVALTKWMDKLTVFTKNIHTH